MLTVEGGCSCSCQYGVYCSAAAKRMNPHEDMVVFALLASVSREIFCLMVGSGRDLHTDGRGEIERYWR